MADENKSRSKYALKVARQHAGTYARVSAVVRRVCDECKLSLSGPKKHGWVSKDGRKIVCAICVPPPGRGARF